MGWAGRLVRVSSPSAGVGRLNLGRDGIDVCEGARATSGKHDRLGRTVRQSGRPAVGKACLNIMKRRQYTASKLEMRVAGNSSQGPYTSRRTGCGNRQCASCSSKSSTRGPRTACSQQAGRPKTHETRASGCCRPASRECGRGGFRQSTGGCAPSCRSGSSCGTGRGRLRGARGQGPKTGVSRRAISGEESVGQCT